MLRYFFILFLFCIISYKSYAAIGCAVGAINYMTVSSGTIYKKTGGTTVPLSGGCAWYYTNPATCSVNGGVGSGQKAYDTPQNCPIDDYIGSYINHLCRVRMLYYRKENLIQFKVN